MPLKVLMQGGGDLASGIARRLYLAGMNVVILEIAMPKAIRRAVSFATAVHEGEVVVEGVKGILCHRPPNGRQGYVPVLVDQDGKTLSIWEPDVLVDARMLKKPPVDTEVTKAPLVLGIGPGFLAGRHCHAVIETQRGPYLGRVIWKGSAEEYTGLPASVGGYSLERVLRSPDKGVFEPLFSIGDNVKKGEEVAWVNHRPIHAMISGVLRGLLYPGTPVEKGEKVGDIDPRGKREYCFVVSDKANAVAGGVMEAIFTFFNSSATPEGSGSLRDKAQRHKDG